MVADATRATYRRGATHSPIDRLGALDAMRVESVRERRPLTHLVVGGGCADQRTPSVVLRSRIVFLLDVESESDTFGLVEQVGAVRGGLRVRLRAFAVLGGEKVGVCGSGNVQIMLLEFFRLNMTCQNLLVLVGSDVHCEYVLLLVAFHLCSSDLSERLDFRRENLRFLAIFTATEVIRMPELVLRLMSAWIRPFNSVGWR